MTLNYSVAGENVVNATRIVGEPAVTLSANNIVFTNTERGRVVSISATAAALVIAGEGARVVNAADGAILGVDTQALAITGSRFADIIENDGTIIGVVQLGGGNDSFIHRNGGSGLKIELAEDNDKLEINGSNFETFYNLAADGGPGEDTLVISGSIGQLWGANIRNFEHLILGPYAENLEFLSGYKSITILGRADNVLYSSVGLLNANNPGADIVFSGGNNFRIGGSSRFANIIATAGPDSVEVFANSGGSPVSSGGVLLGEGDDTFRLSKSAGGTISIANGVNGGPGYDSFNFSITDGEVFDASAFVGFEYFDGGNWTSGTTVARVIGLNGYQRGSTDGDGGSLTIGESVSPLGSIGSGAKGVLIFESTTVFGYFGVSPFSFPDYRLTAEQADPLVGQTFINSGRIINDVLLSVGDDIYDGRLGSVGGRIYGYAGNDVLRAGTGGSWIDGGFGADDLYGNSGSDTLIGGGGGDILIGGTGADVLTGGTGVDIFRGTAAELRGDTITDLAPGERITFLGASLGGGTPFTFSLSGNTLTFSGGSLTLQNLPAGVRFAASANTADGGVDLTLQRANLRNDFNGDGRSDILWRNVNGQLSQWLGTANGGFTGNVDVVNQSVPNAWKIAGTVDFNGDGRADILWRNDSGQLSQWLGTANGGFIGNGAVVNQSVQASWKIAGTADFNGDGRADILWRNDNGQLSQWLGNSDGGFVGNGGVVNQSAAAAWKIAGTADFNGDGRADILWRNDSGQLGQWLGTANGGFVGSGGLVNQSAPAAWKIASTADFNGDGLADILWRNDSGQLSQWLGSTSAGFIGNGGLVNQMVGNDWKIASTADFNGDGYADILWRNDNGRLAEWLGTASGGFIDNSANVNQIVPNAWMVNTQDGLLI